MGTTEGMAGLLRSRVGERATGCDARSRSSDLAGAAGRARARPPITDPEGKTTLLVASGGGHLTQLHRLAPRLEGLSKRRLWVTFDTPQARSLLAGERVQFVPYVAPRDYRAVGRAIPEAARLFAGEEIGTTVSTGAGLALAYLPQAAVRGIDTHYIESATRVDGPSVTGRLLSFVPGVHTHTQYERWADRRWSYLGSVFEGFRKEAEAPARSRVRKVLVSLGTIRPFAFRRLVQRVHNLLPSDVEVTWQTGCTSTAGLPIRGIDSLEYDQLLAEAASSDVVVAHAGTGIALTALEAGKLPILVPRESVHGEHIDDHQRQIATELSGLGLALSRSVDELSLDDLVEASHWHVRDAERAPALVL